MARRAPPAAIVQNGTTADEKIVCGTVRDIAYRAQYEGLSNPAVIIVGEVVQLAAASLRLNGVSLRGQVSNSKNYSSQPRLK